MRKIFTESKIIDADEKQNKDLVTKICDLKSELKKQNAIIEVE